MNIHKKQLRLYGIIGNSVLKDDISISVAVEEALKGGATMIQLREKDADSDEIIKIAEELKPICKKYQVPLIINDSVQIAYKSGADGVHLGADDGDLIYARRILGEKAIIGATAHNLHEAQAAWAAGADYLGCGAIFNSPTKKNTVPLSIDTLGEICMRIPIPVVAIGGINYENIMQLKGSGVDGVAVISDLFATNEIRTTAAALKDVVIKMTTL